MIVPVGADGNIRLYNDVRQHPRGRRRARLPRSAGRRRRPTTGRVVPLDAPFRVFDTRQPEFGSAPLGLGHVARAGASPTSPTRCNLGGVPVGAQIGAASATSPAPGSPGSTRRVARHHVPHGVSRRHRHAARELEHQRRRGPDRAEHVAAAVRHDGTDANVIQAYNYAGSVHYLFDVYAVILPSCSASRRVARGDRGRPRPAVARSSPRTARACGRLRDRIAGLIRSVPAGPGPLRPSNRCIVGCAIAEGPHD